MASPFAVLRKNQKTLLAVFGVIIMFTFVVGGGVDDYLRNRFAGRVEQAPLVTWANGAITDQDLAYLRHKHQVAMRFLEEVLKLTQDRKGTPKLANVTRNEFGQIVPGLRRCNSAAEFVQTLVLAEKADQIGLVVDDAAVFDFLRRLSDGKLDDADYGRIIDQIPNRRMTPQQVFDELRLEIKAHDMLTMVRNGLFATTPASTWQSYKRLHHRVQAEILPVKVADYVSQVSNPSDKEVADFFEANKTRFSHPDYPEPGFRQRKKAAFEYLKFDFNQFLEAEKKKITDEQVKQEYDARVSRGDFRAAELPSEEPAGDAKPSAEKPEGDAKPGAEKPASDAKPADSKPEAKDGEKPAEKSTEKPGEKPADKAADKPADDKKPEEKKAEAAKPEEKKPEEKKSDEKKPEAPKPEEKKADDKKPEEKKPEDKKPDQGAAARSSNFTLVN
ncbi:MAG TPA: hypothetical protein PLV92_14510, partial [Pirellulaceae bacterium]|nr:hypothetical protein [Pirellulaceae bacterium]